MQGSRIRFYRPAERLRPYLEAYRFADLDSGELVRDLLPPASGTVCFTLAGYWILDSRRTSANSAQLPARLAGPTSFAIRATGFPPTRTVSAVLRPPGWAGLIGQPACDFADRIEPLDDVFPGQSEPLLQRLEQATDDKAVCVMLDDFFLAVAASRPSLAPRVARAHALLGDARIRSVAAFADGLQCSRRHATRLARTVFGFAPKLLLRRDRFLRTLATIRQQPTTSWGHQIDAGYCDHSHFVRDFHDFMGMSPGAYFGRASLTS